MEFSKLVSVRRSVRAYLEQPVPREVIDRCLEAARMAPSACNSQPWHFIIIDDPEQIRTVVAAACSGIYSINRFIRTAPVLILIVTEHSKYIARLGGRIRDIRYNLIDIGIAGDHLTLQAAELGLGTCWIGWFNEDQLKQVMNLKSDTHIDIMISLGYPADSVAPVKKRKSLNDIRTYKSLDG